MSVSTASDDEPRRSTEIKYISEQVPQVQRLEYAGTTYEALVPDTLDLRERAAL